jgi:hypothetical protein
MKKLLIAPIASLALAIAPIAQATITTDVAPYSVNCQVAYPCQVWALHSLHIVNDTQQAQTYNWFYSIQAENGDTVKMHDTVTLQPGQEFRSDKTKNWGYMKFNMKGRKVLRNITQADGYEHGTVTKTSWVDVS